MTRIKRVGSVVGAIIGGVLLFVALTVLFIPTATIRGAVDQGLARHGYTMTAQKFGKALPLGLSARKLEISGAKGEIFRADEASVRLRVLPFLIGKLKIGVDGRIGTGRISGGYTVNRGGSVRVDIDRVRLEDIPFFATVAGVQAKGELRGKADINALRTKPAGEVQVQVRAAELTGLKVGVMPLPDAAYSAIQGKVTLRGGKATIESFTLQGEGLYARLKGDFPVMNPLSAAPLNVTLELMPKPEFLEKQKWVFLLLTKYLDTPGHYQIPVRGTLGQPAVF